MSDILNVEIKARCLVPNSLHDKLMALGADFKGEDHQIDTYFQCDNGRLKMREGDIENSLIFYKRENTADSKSSEIVLERLTTGHNLKPLLSASNGVKVVVDKKRKIYFIDNVKFHIDEVKGLGSFMEIEAIDESGQIGLEKLSEQCDFFVKKLEIYKKDFIQVSYSDLLLETFKDKIYREAEYFLEMLYHRLSDFNLSSPDHLCFRTETRKEYENFKQEFSAFSSLLIESKIGGRDIATYKLKTPIEFKDWKVDVIEIPAPKENANYASGFEHAEFVIKESFEQYIAKFPTVKWNLKSSHKAINPEIRFEVMQGVSVKFHHQSLEQVIKIEKQML